jgi:hypothetical protein
VKKGVATLKVREEEDMEGFHLPGGPVVRNVPAHDGKNPEPRQAAVNMSMEDWRDLIEAYQVEECDVPHRIGSKHEKPSTSSNYIGQPSTPPLVDDDQNHSVINSGDRGNIGRAGQDAELSPLHQCSLLPRADEI